jgi:formamidopyrimidine-DNA glycosylase
MPELPEITAYLEGLERTILGEPLEQARVRFPAREATCCVTC